MIKNEVLSIKYYLTRMVSKILKVYRQNEPTFAAKLIGFEIGPDDTKLIFVNSMGKTSVHNLSDITALYEVV